MAACRPWLEWEIGLLRPAVMLGLGATAGRALVGPSFRLNRQRGQWLTGPDNIPTLVTYQPAYLLRLEEPQRSQADATIATDLAVIRARLEQA
jgi:DNA polymerase